MLKDRGLGVHAVIVLLRASLIQVSGGMQDDAESKRCMLTKRDDN